MNKPKAIDEFDELPLDKKGRPKGSKPKKRADVLSLPASCPKCHSTDVKIERLEHSVAGAGSYAGQRYTHVDYHHAKCSCGQYLRVRTFKFDGERLLK